LNYAKWGLAHCRGRRDLPALLAAQASILRETTTACQPVVVAYADDARADSPPPEQVVALAIETGFGVLLLDTWAKDGPTLLDWMPSAKLLRLRELCRASRLRLALAGALGPKEIVALRHVR